MPDLFQLPRYQAAVKREGEIRNAAFLNLPADICGVKVMQMTLWHWIILDGAEAPFINGFDINQPPQPVAIILFLWILTKEFYWLNLIGLRSGRFISWRQKRFTKRIKKLDYAKLVESCLQYVSDTFQDTLPSSGEGKFYRAPHWSYPAAIIHVVAAKYGWDDEMILRRPLKVLLQLQKLIDAMRQAEAGNTPVLFNSSDAVKHAEITEQREKRAAAEKSKLHSGQQVAD